MEAKMPEVLGAMQVQLGLDASKFGDGLTSSKRAVNYFNSEVRKLDTVMKGSGKSVDALSAKQKSLKQAMESQSNVLKKLKTNFDAAKPGTAQYERLATEIEKANVKMVDLESQSKRTSDELKQTISRSGLTGKLQTAGTKIDALGGKLRAAGDAMAPVSLALTAGLTISTKKAMDFEGQMQVVKSLLADTIPNAEALTKKTEEMGEKSKTWAKQYGVSTTEVNHAMEELIKKGFSANETIDAMPALLDAAKASGDDFTTVMDASSSALQQFGIEAKDTGRVTNAITYIANKTSSGFSDLGEALKYVGPVAKATNNNLEETTSALGLLSDAGILGSNAGTSLRTSMLKLSQINTNAAISKFTELLAKGAAGSQTLADEYGKVAPKIDDVSKRIEQASAELADATQKGDKKRVASTKQTLKDLQGEQEGYYTQVKKYFEKLSFPDQINALKEMKKSWMDTGGSVQDFNGIIGKLVGTESLTGMTVLIDKGGDAIKGMAKETKAASGYTKELADTMQKSSKSGVERFKSSLEVLQISVGQKVLPALTPLVDFGNNLMDTFSKLPPEAQTAFVGIAAGVALAYPALNFAGNLTSGFGKTLNIIGKIGGMAKANLAGPGIVASAGEASAALGGAGGLTASIGTVGPALSGLLPIAVGVLGAVGIGALIWKLTEGVRENKKEIDKWGEVVGKGTSSKLDTLNEKFVKVTTATKDFDIQGTPAIGNVKSAIDQLGKAAKTSIDETQKAMEKGAAYAGISDKEIEASKKAAEQQKNNIQTMADATVAIYQKAASEKRDITDAERAIVENNQKAMIATTIENYGITGDKAKEIMKVFSGDIVSMNSDALKQSSNTVKEMMNAETKAYQDSKKSLQLLKSQDVIDDTEYKARLRALETSHNDKMTQYGEEFINVKREQQKRELEGTGNNSRLQANIRHKYNNEIRKSLEDLGVNYDDLVKKMGESGKKSANDFGDSGKLIAQYATNMSDEAKKASDSWNAMIFDPKTGEVKTNAKEVIQEAVKTPEGWNNMTFIAKNANLTTNARKTIIEALQANGQWDQLKPAEKQLIIGNDVALFKLHASKQELNDWNNLPAKQKDLWAKDSTKAGVAAAQATMSTLKDVERLLTSKNLTRAQKEQAQATMNSLKDVQRILTSRNATLPEKIAAQNTMNSLQNVTRNLQAANLTGPGVASANAFINSNFTGKEAALTANASSAQTTLDNFLLTPATKTIQLIASGGPTHEAQGTNYHQGGLAMVNDQGGPLYKELVTLPNGQSFIPEGRDVILPLPRGSKVLKARDTAHMMAGLVPKYAKGTGGIPANAKIFKEMGAIDKKLSFSAQRETENNSRYFEKMIDLLQIIASKELIVNDKPTERGTPTAREFQRTLDYLLRDLGYSLN